MRLRLGFLGAREFGLSEEKERATKKGGFSLETKIKNDGSSDKLYKLYRKGGGGQGKIRLKELDFS